jgi:hypothetical protein
MASLPLGAGTYNVGFCVRAQGPVDIDRTDYVNGWVAVTD